MSGFTYAELVEHLMLIGVPRERAEHQAAQECGIRAPSADEMRAKDEDAHVDEGDRLMRALGFDVVKLSQKRRSKVTEGVPDRKYYHRRRRLTLWWEAKAVAGRQRPDQRAFQEMAEACGETYVLGTLEALTAWLVDAGVAAREDGQLHPTPIGA